MDAQTLTRTGLPLNEAKIYIVLLEWGSAQAGAISKKAQINRTTTYDVLERLINKGLVTFVIESNTKIFSAIDPDRLLDIAKEQEKATQEILPGLKNLYSETKEKENVKVYKGRRGLKIILHEILNYKEYYTDGSKGNFHKIMKHDFFAFQQRKKERGIKSTLILGEGSRNAHYLQEEDKNTRIRLIADEYASPASTFIYGDNVAIIVWSSTPMATVITSNVVADSYRKHFEFLYKIAKP